MVVVKKINVSLEFLPDNQNEVIKIGDKLKSFFKSLHTNEKKQKSLFGWKLSNKEKYSSNSESDSESDSESNSESHDDFVMDFWNACKNGDINEVKSIFSYDSVGLQRYKEKGFYYACVNGHLEVAKWLYSLGGINIKAVNDETFGISDQNTNSEIVKWLTSIC